ncbi:MAG: AAA family ATPase [Fuerstiella sp.]
MYKKYWKLSEKPFCYRVEVGDLYRSRSVQAALLRLRYCIDNNAGLAMLLGASGVGKSSLIRLLQAEDEGLRPFVHIAAPRLSPQELARAVACELMETETVDGLSPEVLLVKQQQHLRRCAENGQHPVIVFDEAHLFGNETLNDVVLPLLNLAETDYSLQFSVVLCGQPVLGSHVGRNAQLRERIAVTASMSGFSEKETGDYIRCRMEHAGGDVGVFSDGAVAAVQDLSGGNPRRINRLCDMALLVGYSDQASLICAEDIEALATEILPAAA